MADLKFTSGNQVGSGSSHGFQNAGEKTTTASKDVSEQALSASREIKDKAAGLVDATSNTIKDKASEFVDTAKDVASQATDKLKQAVDGQRVRERITSAAWQVRFVEQPKNLTQTFR
jgi:gas vesicle protein